MHKMITLNEDNSKELLLLRYQLSQTNIPKHLIGRGIKYLNITTEEQAKDQLILNKKQKWNHPFISKSNNYKVGDLCLVCRQSFIKHKGDDSSKRSHSVLNALTKRESHLNEVKGVEEPSKHKRSTSVHMSQMPLAMPMLYSFCPICLSNDCEKMQTLPCQHRFCMSCFEEHIKTQINLSNVKSIKCPEKSCGLIIQEELYYPQLSDEYKRKIEKYKKRSQIEKIKNSKYCPYPNCESYALLPSKEEAVNELDVIILMPNENKDNILTCIENKHQFCEKCYQPPHPGVQCNRLQEKRFDEWKKKAKTKKCPQCKTEIEKIGGCNHMTCTKPQCLYQFCWICLGKYKSNHYSNPLTPCFKLNFSNRDSLCIRCRVLLIVLRVIGLIILFFLALGLALAWPGLILSIPCAILLAEEFNNEDFLFKLIYIGVFFFLSIALIPIAYICIFGFVAALPLIVIGGGFYLFQESIKS